MKYQKSKPSHHGGASTTTVNQGQQLPSLSLHEISTQSIMQTSALLQQHCHGSNNNDGISTANSTSLIGTDRTVVTPTNHNGNGIKPNDVDGIARPVPFRIIDDDDDDDSGSGRSNETSTANDSTIVLVKDDGDDDDVDVMPSTCITNNHSKMMTDRSIGRRHDDIHASFISNDVVVSAACRVRVSSPLGEPKEVRFMTTLDDTDDPRRLVSKITFDDDDDDNGNRNLEEMNEREKESFVLHEQLRNVLSDLSAEKAIRFKKEKSLVKLAKELKKRNLDIAVYERKLIQMARFINALQNEIQQQQEKQLIGGLRNTDIADAFVVTATAATQTESTTAVSAEQIQSMQSTIDTLRRELQESQQQQSKRRMLQQQPVTVPEQQETNDVPVETKSVSAKSNSFAISFFSFVFGLLVTMVLVAVVAAATVIISDTDIVSKSTMTTKQLVQNVLCAPIRPGTMLLPNHSRDASSIYEAPWWVPNSHGSYMKQIVYSTICSNMVPRASIRWMGDKLTIYDTTSSSSSSSTSPNSNNMNSKILLQGRGPAGARFFYYNTHSGHTIQLLRTNRAGITLPAPWMS